MSSSLTERPTGPRARFQQPPEDQRDVVRLTFPRTTDTIKLYAHNSTLRQRSGVLSNALDDATTGPMQRQQADAASDCSIASIPLDDDYTTAWEDALNLMYPSVPLFQVTGENAGRLLLLADKYDMPCITEHARLFLSRQQGGTTALQQHLTADNALEWLSISSRVGLADCASQCINYVVSNSLPLSSSYLSSLQPDMVQQLCEALQQQVAVAAAEREAAARQMRCITLQLDDAKQEIRRLEPLQREVNKLRSNPGYCYITGMNEHLNQIGLRTPNPETVIGLSVALAVLFLFICMFAVTLGMYKLLAWMVLHFFS